MLVLVVLTFSISVINLNNSFGQEKVKDIKSLKTDFKSVFDKKGTFFIEKIEKDRLFLGEEIIKALKTNGFNVTEDKKEATYILTLKYKDRKDTGCDGAVIEDLNGQIFDIKNTNLILEFSFEQGVFTSKCSCIIMQCLSQRILDKSK